DAASVRDHTYLDMLIFFEQIAHVADLHSLPTRRSSDLLSLNASASEKPIIFACSSSLESRFALTTYHISIVNANLDSRLEEHAKDRKSTRLNSSHVSISYAVFCLKIKNNKKKLTE